VRGKQKKAKKGLPNCQTAKLPKEKKKKEKNSRHIFLRARSFLSLSLATK